MNSKTKIRTEYAACGRHTGCNWKPICMPYCTTADAAQNQINEHIEKVRCYPKIYTKYDEYKVMKRTIITVTEEWGDM